MNAFFHLDQLGEHKVNFALLQISAKKETKINTFSIRMKNKQIIFLIAVVR